MTCRCVVSIQKNLVHIICVRSESNEIWNILYSKIFISEQSIYIQIKHLYICRYFLHRYADTGILYKCVTATGEHFEYLIWISCNNVSFWTCYHSLKTKIFYFQLFLYTVNKYFWIELSYSIPWKGFFRFLCMTHSSEIYSIETLRLPSWL